ncbi:MAG: hypothetical protein KDM91_10470 [Verrucomicrobiae bacterium]|nr:hypothetical protein [Verrucomicrobiae bacterium]MCP5542090.1 hypothetical protein [Akkermansiaceae bacterium]
MKTARAFNLLSAVAVWTVCLTGSAKDITVKSTSGQSMDVEVLAYTKSSGNVRIKRTSDGQIFNVKLDAFDAESQKKIADAAPVAMPKLNIEVSNGARRAREGNSSYMKRQEITASVSVKNESRDIDLAKTKFTILLIGRNTSRFADRDQDWSKILANETFTNSLPAGQELKFECKPIMTSYDSDKDYTNVGGWDFDGYLLVLQDEEGRVIEAKTSIGVVESSTLKDKPFLAKATQLSVGTEVERDLTPHGRNR